VRHKGASDSPLSFFLLTSLNFGNSGDGDVHHFCVHFHLVLVVVEEEKELGGFFMKEMLILSADSTVLQVE
jgi:hypothetical protein